MARILLIEAWKNRVSGLLGLSAFLFTLFWPSVPLRGIDLWLQTLAVLYPTKFLYPFLAFLTGSFVAIYIYNKRVQSCCSVRSLKSASSASLVGVLLGACPACIPVIAFFLPLSITLVLSYFSWIFLVSAVVILLFAIYRMNGFKQI